jgi:hypothetical protein
MKYGLPGFYKGEAFLSWGNISFYRAAASWPKHQDMWTVLSEKAAFNSLGICSIPCQDGTVYIGQIGYSLSVCQREFKPHLSTTEINQ